ncbi:MAG: WS/DGAT domain-containing protein, partial [Acidimicrobiales bacterium]
GYGRIVRDCEGSVTRIVEGRRNPDKPVGAAPLGAPRTPFNGALTAHRHVGFARVPLADVKAVKNHFGVTVNDVVLALCSGTVRRYLQGRDALPAASLTAVCPISVRDGAEVQSANRVSAMFTSLATDIDDTAERLRAIALSTKGAKEEHNAVGADMLRNWAEFAGPNTFNLASRLYSSLGIASSHRPIHNMVISNVPGPSFPLYYAGAEMVAAYPMGPVMEGAGLNITVMSYRDAIDIGFMVDRELVPDVWDLVAAAQPALDDLLRAAGLPTGQDDRPGTRASKATPTRRRTKKKATASRA